MITQRGIPQIAAGAALVLGAALLLLSPRLPYWSMTVKAPQYPRGLTLTVYPHRLDGDVHEVDMLNHYIGMRSLQHGAVLERRFAWPVLLCLAAALVIAIWVPLPWAVLLVIPAIVFPLIFAGDLYWWMRDFGLNLDPKAPFSRAVKPFIPPLIGPGTIAQFKAHAAFGAGFYLSGLTALLALAGMLLKRRTRWTLPWVRIVISALAIVAVASPLEAATWHVSADGAPTTLAGALAAAAPGDTVVLHGGVYAGPVVIDKSLIIEGRDGSVIDGHGRGTVVRVTAPDVTLRGVTIRRSGNLLAADDAGIMVAGPRAIIEDNRLEDVLVGIHLRRSDGTIVRRNRLSSLPLPVARRGDLLRIWYSSDVQVLDNDIRGGRDAVLWYSKNLLLRSNRVSGGRYGLHFMYCNDALIEDNDLLGNSVGVYLMYSRGVQLLANRLVGNRGPSGYGLGLKDMQDVTAQRNIIADNRAGIFLEGASGDYTANTIARNDAGLLLLTTAQGNRFVGNNFMDNGEQVVIEGQAHLTANRWDGNFWSDYRGFDVNHDGTGEAAYQSWRLFERLTERYPALRLFADSPSALAIDAAARLFPLFAPQPRFSDARPHVLPHRLPVRAQRPVHPIAWLAFAVCAFGGAAATAAVRL